jgi:peptide/nickel transport system ATP-binding protein
VADTPGASPAAPLLQVERLSTRFTTPRGVVRAVDRVSIDVARGETVAIVGESGSGKTMLVRSIMGIVPRAAQVTGRITYDGTDVATMSKAQRKHFWGPEIAMVFQDPMTSLNPVKKIGRQIEDPLKRHLKLSGAAARQRSLELLELVGIPEPARRLKQYPHEMSGGMRQRVGIAIALSCQPQLLIADEPTTALDVTVQRQILDLLGGLQDQLGMAIILITHDLGVAAGRASRVAVMYAGQIVEHAETSALFRTMRHPYTEALFASIPRLDEQSHAELKAIPGRPPDMASLPPGCRFAPRCRYATDECVATVPKLRPAPGRDHEFACFHPLGEAAAAAPSTSAVAAGGPAETA